MTLKNEQIYERNPLSHSLANNGVAQVTQQEDEDRQAYERTLRFELENFVCEGEYLAGLERLLGTFISRMNAGEQPSPFWLSGFYGAGKSHLAKMLAALWVNYEFADGSNALSVAIHLPQVIRDLLKELYAASKKHGGLHVATGLLNSGGATSALSAVLGVVFKSVGLPGKAEVGRFVLWLKEQGYYDRVLAAVEGNGKTMERALANMVASKEIRETLAQCDGGLGSDEEVRKVLRTFNDDKGVDADSFRRDVERALELGHPDIPLTLLVLDEVQQFIGTDSERTLQIQLVAEICQTSFKRRVQLVATGQAAMGSTDELQKLKGRFPSTVTLTDNDAEDVIRKTVLLKSTVQLPHLQKKLDAASGEISRHLTGTKIASNSKDAELLVADYPLLPTRRRFFEAVLRAVDATGVISQLRNQLRVAYEAAKATASFPVGHVVGGDFIFDELQSSETFNQLCPMELSNKIRTLSGSNDERERMMGRIMKLVFVINKLPVEGSADLGVRATEEILSDLLVTDLTADSAPMRALVPELLKCLDVEHNLLMAIVDGGQVVYRENTKESANWQADFQAADSEIRSSKPKLDGARADLMKAAVTGALSKLRVTQGQMSQARDYSLTFADVLPADAGKQLTIWVQDGWATSQKTVERAAQAAGIDSSTLFVFIPERSRSDLNDAIVAQRAAEQTLQKRGTPTTPAGRDAQKMMERRASIGAQTIETILKDAISDALVYQGGGAPIEGDTLLSKVSSGVGSSLPRLFTNFSVGDHKDWNKAFEKARTGDPTALAVVGYPDAGTHPVSKELLGFYGTAGKKGAEAQERYEAAPYGWPREAIKAATLALLTNGFLKAKDASNAALTTRQIEASQFTKILFQAETTLVQLKDKLAVVGILKKVGIPCGADDVVNKSGMLALKLHDLRLMAGGDAPRPAHPAPTLIQEIEKVSGNDQVVAIAAKRAEIVAAIDDWAATAGKIDSKIAGWKLTLELLAFAVSLPSSKSWQEERDAIVSQRALLAPSDPVGLLKAKLEVGLRSALVQAAAAYTKEYAEELRTLEESVDWQKLNKTQQQELLGSAGMPSEFRPDTSSTEAMVQELKSCDLGRWQDRIAALSGRFSTLQTEASKLVQPKAIHVKLPSGVLQDEAEVRAWLSAVEANLLEAVKTNPVRV